MTGQFSAGLVMQCRVRAQSMPSLVSELMSRAKRRLPTRLYLANVHMLMEAVDDASFAAVLARSDFVLADGKPLCWWQQLVNGINCPQLRGIDLVLALCRRAAAEGLRVGIYGGHAQADLQVAVSRLQQLVPGLQVCYQHAPAWQPLPAGADPQQLQLMQQAQLDIILVALGCPKQEIWIDQFSAQLPPLQLGIGAVIDFLSGRRQQAPRWVQRLALEWLFRWLQEPRRLAPRYLRHNPRFLISLCRAWWQQRNR
ncbi:MAG: WecB/TagA/CpsF family glycosyltransferase [Rheinheimera sp.]|nr:WecB/TagA/CpsF family glycosyltransferase [Rheinheimera sp.]